MRNSHPAALRDAMRYPEAAAYLGVHPVTLHRLTKAKVIPCVRPSAYGRTGKRGIPVWFRKADLDAHIAKTTSIAK